MQPRSSPLQPIAPHARRLVGRNHVKRIRDDLHAATSLDDRHLGVGSEQFREQAAMRRIEVLSQQERHTPIGRQGAEQRLECLQVARGSSHCHDPPRGTAGRRGRPLLHSLAVTDAKDTLPVRTLTA